MESLAAPTTNSPYSSSIPHSLAAVNASNANRSALSSARRGLQAMDMLAQTARAASGANTTGHRPPLAHSGAANAAATDASNASASGPNAPSRHARPKTTAYSPAP